MTDTRPLKERLEEEKALIDALPDSIEQMLATAEFKARIALIQAATVENTRNWRAQDKALKEYREQRTAVDNGQRFKNIEQAANWIISQGFIVSARSVRNHADKPGFPKKQKDGCYLQAEIAAYAAANWDNPAKPVIDDPAEQKMAQRNDLIAEQTRKLRLANEITEGMYIRLAKVEQQFASRAAFLKQDLANYGPFVVDRFIEFASSYLKAAGIDLDSISLASIAPDLVSDYDLRLEKWLDRYTRPLEVDGE